jgi:predicted Zn-dependent protease
VRLVSEIVDDGVRRPGFTHYVDDGSLVIEVTSERFAAVIPHEMGHVLYPHPGHVQDATSLMSDAGGLGEITAADLEYVCAGYGCKAFVPETTE